MKGRTGRIEPNSQTGLAEQTDNSQKMTGEAGLPEKVCQEKNAETGIPGQDSQDTHDSSDRQNGTGRT